MFLAFEILVFDYYIDREVSLARFRLIESEDLSSLSHLYDSLDSSQPVGITVTVLRTASWWSDYFGFIIIAFF